MDETGEALDGDNLAYGLPKDVVYPVTRKEFDELHGALNDVFDCGLSEVDDEESHFPEWEQSFVFEGVRFIWWMMVGQGSAAALFPARYNEEKPFFDRQAITIREDGNHEVPKRRHGPVRNSTRKPGEELAFFDGDIDQGMGVLNKMLKKHGLRISCRDRKSGGVYLKIRKRKKGSADAG